MPHHRRFEGPWSPPAPVKNLNSLMDKAALQQWILRRLGAPFIKVELDQDHLDDVVELAQRWFSAKKGVMKQAYVTFFTGIVEYQLAPDVDVVTDVAFPTNPMDISLVFSPYILQDEKVPYDVFAAPTTAGLYSSYTQTIQYVEMAKRILSAEPDWRQERDKLFIFPVPRHSGRMLVDYKSHDFTIEQLSERDHDLLKRYALAQAKMDIGTIRSKYGDHPGAQGVATLDGERLKQEAANEIEALEKELRESAMPIGFMKG